MLATANGSEHELRPLRRSSTSDHEFASASSGRASQQSSPDVGLLLQQPEDTKDDEFWRSFLVVGVLALLACTAFFGAQYASHSIRNQPFSIGNGTRVAGGVHAHAGHLRRRFVALVTGSRHCRPKPDSVLGHGGREALHVNRGQNHSMSVPQRRQRQILAPARKSGLLTIMTPVFPDNATLGLLHNQLRSANRYLHMDTIHEWLLITPAGEVDRLAEFLEDVLELLPCVLPSKIRIVEDEACAPELRPQVLDSIAARFHRDGELSGWYKQQLIKLACSFTVETPWYLITDADTFFLGELSALDLMEQVPCTNQSAVCDTTAKIQFRARSELQPPDRTDKQVSWVISSGQTLKMPPVLVNSLNQSMGVTPQTISTAIVSQMAHYLEKKVAGGKDNWRTYLLDFAFRAMVWENGTYPNGHDDWPSPWSEYELYYGYSQNKGLWDRYHVHDYLQINSANLWNLEDLPAWKPCNVAKPGYWAVVQSTVNLSAARIWKRLAPCMDLSNGISTRGVYNGEPYNETQSNDTAEGT